MSPGLRQEKTATGNQASSNSDTNRWPAVRLTPIRSQLLSLHTLIISGRKMAKIDSVRQATPAEPAIGGVCLPMRQTGRRANLRFFLPKSHDPPTIRS